MNISDLFFLLEILTSYPLEMLTFFPFLKHETLSLLKHGLVSLKVLKTLRYIVCFNLISGICACLVTVILKKVENSRNVVLSMKSYMYRVRFFWWHVESAVLRRGRGQVYPGTVRCKYERVAYTGSVTCEGGRDGTARVVLVGVAGVVPGGNRLVCCCRRCSEDLGRELHKFTYIQRAGKCWNRIGTSTIVFLILFYDG